MCFSSLCSPLVAAAQHSDAKAGSLLQHLKVCLGQKKKQKTGQILGNGVNYYIVTRQLSSSFAPSRGTRGTHGHALAGSSGGGGG